MKKENAVIHKNFHPRGMLSGIPTALNNTQGGDPRQKPSGMTTNLNNPSHGEVANFNAPSTLREGTVPEGRYPGVDGVRVRGIVKEEALNKNDFRAPLRSGFTLIELLVVVLIIGILAAVALPQYQMAVKKSRAAEALMNVKALIQAQQMYYLENGTYTADISKLDVEAPTNSNNYEYGCHNSGYCRAVTLVKDAPDFLCYVSSVNQGVFLCSADGKNEKAKSVCKSMGGVLFHGWDKYSWAVGNYFVLN